MLGGLFLMLWLDSLIQFSTLGNRWHHQGLKGVGLLVLLNIVLPLATGELAILFTAERVRPYRLISAFGSVL